jgi:DNA polymerase III subunit alpha
LQGDIAWYLFHESELYAEQLALQYSSLFGEGCFYLGIQDHGLLEEKEVNRAIDDVPNRLSLPIVALNDVHYVNRSDAEAHAVLRSINKNERLIANTYLDSSHNLSNSFM